MPFSGEGFRTSSSLPRWGSGLPWGDAVPPHWKLTRTAQRTRPSSSIRAPVARRRCSTGDGWNRGIFKTRFWWFWRWLGWRGGRNDLWIRGLRWCRRGERDDLRTRGVWWLRWWLGRPGWGGRNGLRNGGIYWLWRLRRLWWHGRGDAERFMAARDSETPDRQGVAARSMPNPGTPCVRRQARPRPATRRVPCPATPLSMSRR